MRLSLKPARSGGVSPWVRAGLWALALAALAAVFAAYLNPHLAFDLASRAWACF